MKKNLKHVLSAFLPCNIAMQASTRARRWIHYYFGHAGKSEYSVEKSKLKVAQKLRDAGASFVFSYG